MFGKRKQKQLQQTVFDVTYKELCPVCKTDVEKVIHQADEKPSAKKVFMECPKCHNVLMGRRVKCVTTLKTYEEDKEELFGLKTIKEEIIKTEMF